MHESDKAMSICLTAALLIGAYTGMFVGEINTFYECEKDGVVTFKGFPWKGETKFDCHRRADQKGGDV